MGMDPATTSKNNDRNSKISELEDMLKNENLSKGQKKNIKKKIKKEK